MLPSMLALKVLVIVWSSHKWTRTGSGTSVIWIWDSIYDCIRLLFADILTLKMIAHVHALTAQQCKIFTPC